MNKVNIPDNMEDLKVMAVDLGLSIQGNLSYETLKERVEEKLGGQNLSEPLEVSSDGVGINPREMNESQRIELVRRQLANIKPASANEIRMRAAREAAKYVRIIVHVNNPEKKNWPGQYYTVGNGVIPAQKKYIPFENSAGWHVQQIIVNHMKEEKYQHFYKAKDQHGNEITRSKLLPAYNIEILDPLTDVELAAIQKRQLADQIEE